MYRAAQQQQEQTAADQQAASDQDTQRVLFSDRIQQRLQQAACHLDAARVVKGVSGLVSQLAEAELADLQTTRVITLLSQLVPLLNQYQHLCTFVLVHQMAAYRSSAKLLSVLLKLFTAMAQKGFCTPEDLQDEQDDAEAGTEFKEVEDGGLGEGQGAKDVSDKLESEDQLEGAYRPGEEPEDADDDVKEEEKGVEMSEDFGGKMQDVEKKDGDEENDDSDDEEEEEEPDKQMGEVDGDDQERLDEKLWGSDDEDDDQQTADDDEQHEGGHGREDAQLAAKEEDTPEDGEDNRKEQRQRQDVKENEMEEDEDQQADPYHNNFAAEPEPEELEVPERAGADSERGSDSDSDAEPEDNPWDIEQKADFPEDGDQKDKEQEPEQEQEGEEQPTDAAAAPEDAEEDEQDEQQEEQADERKAKSDEKAEQEDEEQQDQEMADTEQEQEPSQLDASEQACEAAQDDAARGTQDQLERPQQVAAEERPDDPSTSTERSEEKAAVGLAESSQSGHQAADASQLSQQQQSRQPRQERAEQRRPGHSDSKRSLGADNQPVEKRLKTVDVATEAEQGEEEAGREQPAQSDLYQHIQEAEQRQDALAADAATREQAQERPVPADEAGTEPDQEEDVQMEDSDGDEQEQEQPDTDRLEPIRPDKLADRRRTAQHKEEAEEPAGPERGQVDGDSVLTSSVQRPADSTAHTALDQTGEPPDAAEQPLPPPDLQQLRRDLESRVDLWEQDGGDSATDEAEAERAWQQYETVISPLAQELCEQLRLILEPTQTAKLMGDYRTGKRLNMRKVIPYIASQFRKDKIWLRRTKPSKRDYQVAIAVDDSSSMSDSQSRQLAFEALALVSRALALLEVGQLAVLSFGETTRLLHGLHEPLGAAAGAQLLRRFTFAQTQTRVAAMLDSVTALLGGEGGGRRPARLLLVVSDGRGLFHEGQETVRRAVRRARQAGIFLVLVIVDSPQNSSSVLDIRMPQFGPAGQLLGIRPYLDSFPFPFYLILRDITSLPAVLSDALRQWFELVTASDR